MHCIVGTLSTYHAFELHVLLYEMLICVYCLTSRDLFRGVLCVLIFAGVDIIVCVCFREVWVVVVITENSLLL